ncbi:MAG: hypothetical protein IJ741_02850 [Schwartzia sp.]|nr:hypothetical protein [Schwartzia sp. (in: firmicutes)]
MCDPLKEQLKGKYVICSCEGAAEEAIMDLLIDNGLLCFCREDLICRECTRIRDGKRLALKYLGTEMERDVVILRILDREKEKLNLPEVYRMGRNIPIFDIVTKPEIEILHILDADLYDDFKAPRNKGVKASAYCKEHLEMGNNVRDPKSKRFIVQRYADNPVRLIEAIRRHRQMVRQKSYSLFDLLA